MRKNYFIKKKFQMSFVSKFVMLIVAEAILITALFMYVSRDTLTTGYMDEVLNIERTPNFFLTPFVLVMLIVGLGIALAGMVIFIILSHRIAGPLYRFEKDLEEIGSGDLTKRINLRKTDQLTELKESFNDLIGSFDQKMSGIKKILAELKNLLQAKGALDDARVSKTLERLESEIDRFKVTESSK